MRLDGFFGVCAVDWGGVDRIMLASSEQRALNEIISETWICRDVREVVLRTIGALFREGRGVVVWV